MGLAPRPEVIADLCSADGEFRLATRHWTGGYRIGMGDEVTGITIRDGEVIAAVPDAGPNVISLSGPAEVWAPMLLSVPPSPANTVSVMVSRGLELDADPLLWWQYLPASERLLELLRGPADVDRPTIDESGASHRVDSPVGRYVHLELGGHDHRIYFEEAGQGIPVLMQHTAGANSVQWRHLFENPAITDHFRLIAYDLPHHGKSIAPVSQRWWESEYRLEGDFLRQVPVGLAAALELDRPVFMGCSVGGLLALDLALHHPDVFRAAISVEGALRIGGDYDSLVGMWHPEVSNQSKARMMEGLCSPTSPEAYVKEVSHVYSSGWPPAFLGDLYYYIVDFDLRERAGEIDTSRCAVHILNGEYDYSGTPQRGRDAHVAIAGSTHTEMANIGHFPMVENPALFMQYLEPILDAVRSA